MDTLNLCLVFSGGLHIDLILLPAFPLEKAFLWFCAESQRENEFFS